MCQRLDHEKLGELTDEITTLCGHIHAAEYRLLELIRQLDEIATNATASQVEKIVRRLRQAISLEERAAALDLYLQRELALHPVDSGAWSIYGQLTPEQGALVRQALDRAMDWVYRNQPMDMRGQAEDDDVASIPRAARMADALVALAERFLGHPPRHDETMHTADRFQVTVHVPAETLRANGAVDPHDPPETEDGSVLAAETARRLFCDAAVVPLLETSDGEPLALGRKTRTISPALRRALKRRDGGCRFPGCTNTRFVDGHHIRHWEDGGETRLDNLVMLCRHHRTLLHEGGYGVVREERAFIFWRADGSIVPHTNDATLSGSIAALMDDQSDLGIDSDTTVPGWDGRRPDYAYITSLLCDRQARNTFITSSPR